MSNDNIDDKVEEELYAEEPTDDHKEEFDTSSESKEDTKEDNSSKSIKLVRRKHYAKQQYSVSTETKLENVDTIVLPSNFDKETRQVIDSTPNIDIADNKESREWVQDLATGLDSNTYEEVFVEALEDETAEFRQQNEVNNINLEAKSPKFKSIENQNLKGERAVIRVLSHLGMGSLFQVPLWHSGIWLTMKPPTDSELIELNRIMVNDKINFGRYTYGLVFSNISSYTTDRLVNFALAHVYDMTASSDDVDISNVKDHISCQDIPSLIWGLVCTMYPKGFNYRRACIFNPEKCNHVLEETLNLQKLQWSNIIPLTDWQKKYMSARQSKTKSLDEINRYKDELVKISPAKIFINEGMSNELSFTLRTPSITEHVDSGYEWITNIVKGIDAALTEEEDLEKRNALIVKHGQATSMHQYSHWVQSIEYSSNIIDDRETINKTLDNLSSDDEVRNEFLDAVTKYIDRSIISLIGIPVFNCPNCKGDQTIKHDHDDFVNILPLDVMQLFFVLLTQRLNRLVQR